VCQGAGIDAGPSDGADEPEEPDESDESDERDESDEPTRADDPVSLPADCSHK